MSDFLANIESEAFLKGCVTTVLVLFGAFIVWILLSRGLGYLEKRPRVSRSMLLPIRLVARYGVLLIALLLILSSFGIQIGNFWTFVSTLLGLVAIGFVAVWSVLSNISSTFFLLLVQPFRVGDFVSIVGDDVMGEVIDINFMFTTIRTKDGDVFSVPNNQFFQKTTLRPSNPKAYQAALKGENEEALASST